MEIENKKSNFQAAYILESEGGEYAVSHYIRSTEFVDPVTVKLWDEADKAMKALREHLKVELSELDI